VSVRATRLSGGLVALAGCLLVAYFLGHAVRVSDPLYWALQSFPVTLSAALTGMGVQLARGRLVADRFLGRLLGWTATGVVVFSMFLAWFYGLSVVFGGRTPLDPPVGIVTIPSLGALGGLLVGTYDARSLERKESVRRLGRVNETLRIATGDLVETADRDALERTVCRRLAESDSFEAAWIGRYDPGAGAVRPTAWAGFDDAVESLVVPVDGGTQDGSVWSRVVRVERDAVVPDVLADRTVGRWRGRFERRDVASVAVVPLVGSGRVYGLACICAERPDAFDDYQREVIGELGRSVGHAVDSIRTQEALEVRERELVERNDRLDEFAGIVSHDLRNPLNVVLGRVALLRETDDHEHLEAIERSGNRMAELVEDLLAVSRANRDAVEPGTVPLATVAAESWRNVETDGVTFDVRVPETTAVRADASRLRSVFENLARNVSEHNEAPLAVRVGLVEPAAATDDGASPVGFFVEDDGDGIPADDRERVFDHGYTTNAGGTGLGLSIVRGVVDAHDWEISCLETRGGGARFEITGVEFEG
jgi:signal transduction histidine kinase